MAEEVKVICPVCENEVGTKEDGTLIKAHRVSGEKCEGSDQPVPTDDTDPFGIDKGQSYETLEGAQDDADTTDDQNDAGDENGSQTGAQDVTASGSFVHTIRVHGSSPYLDDKPWHTENGLMATAVAQEAGHVPVAEAQHVETVTDGEWFLVRYEVPVK